MTLRGAPEKVFRNAPFCVSAVFLVVLPGVLRSVSVPLSLPCAGLCDCAVTARGTFLMPITGGQGCSSHLRADSRSCLPGSVPADDWEIPLNQVQGSSFVESPGNEVPVVHELGGLVIDYSTLSPRGQL